ncbi:MAG: beta-lactamase family protein [Bryobacteraceae bacterium]|nr:beta-lactamase family protein [Bryobacteraceae bacterium]
METVSLAKMTRRLFASAGLAAPLAFGRWKRLPDGDVLSRIPEWLDASPVPGLALALVSDGKLAYEKAFGMANAAAKVPATEQTIFQAASLSKPVVAMAALKVRDSGKLDVNRPLISYLPGLFENESAHGVTAAHVLSHSSGFPNWRFEAGQRLTPAFPPGEKFQYSGEGFVALGRVLEELTGKPLEGLAQELVLRPLGMASSSFVALPAMQTRMALGHNRRGVANERKTGAAMLEIAARWGKPMTEWRYADCERANVEAKQPPLPNWMLPNAAASLATTVGDYARFAIAAMNRTDWFETRTPIRAGLSWGLGWGLESTQGRKYAWHWGDNSGFKDFVILEPSARWALVVFTNGDNGARVYERVVTRATGHEHPAFLWI